MKIELGLSGPLEWTLSGPESGRFAWSEAVFELKWTCGGHPAPYTGRAY